MKELWTPFLICAVVTGGWTRPVRGDDLDRVLGLVEAIKNRQEGYNPVDFHYKIKSTRTKYHFAGARRIDPSDRRLFAELRDATTESHGH